MVIKHLEQNKFRKRRELTEKILAALAAQSPIVLSISAPFGGGKTFFINMMMEMLDKETETQKNIRYVVFNAWQYDMWSNPLEAFIDAISPQMFCSGRKNISKQIKRAYRKLTKLIPNLLLNAASWTISRLTHGIINDIGNVIRKILSDKEKVAKNSDLTLIETMQKKKKALSEYKQALEIDALYIFIDELDRCKPSFAIKLLEMINHLFFINDEKISYIISVDKKQLCEIIHHTYGYGFDAAGYLRRFFNFSYKISPPRSYKDYLDEVIQSDAYSSKLKEMKNPITEIIELFNPDFRTLDQILHTINSAIIDEVELFDLNAWNEKKIENVVTRWEVAYCYIFFIVLKIIKKDVYSCLVDSYRDSGPHREKIAKVETFISNLLRGSRNDNPMKQALRKVPFITICSQSIQNSRSVRAIFRTVDPAISICDYIVNCIENLDID